MLLSKEVEIGLRGNKSIPYYREMGYAIPMTIGKKGKPVVDYSQKITVKVEDLPRYSEAKVLIRCEYNEDGCKQEYYKSYSDYYKNNIDCIVHKDCCSNRKCQSKKTADCNMANYGFEYHINQPNTIKRMEATNIKRYGSKNMFGSEYFINKTKEVVLDKYGVENISQLEEIKIKKAQTFYRNGTVRTSRQQKYLHELFGGELNYANNTPSLDIAFPEDKIYLEFNGSGHDLCVKTGYMSQDDFNNRERQRYYYLKGLGWKGIFIISPQDYLPSDEILMDEFNNALAWFQSSENGHAHYNINIGNKIKDEVYGDLRRITESDLDKVV